jgi:AhpD family alkylhydroperoxidase
VLRSSVGEETPGLADVTLFQRRRPFRSSAVARFSDRTLQCLLFDPLCAADSFGHWLPRIFGNHRAVRIDYYSHKPEFIAAARKLTATQQAFSIEPALRALVELRVSQLNGCAYCTDLHARELRESGESNQRLDLLVVWPGSPLFTAKEKAALRWAEAITVIAQEHVPDSDYAAVAEFYSEAEIVELTITVSLTNFWNRIAGSFRREPAGECVSQ